MTEEKIQAYVMGELPPEEAALVAEALAQDPALAALAQEYEQIAEGFRQQRVAALQQELLAYDKTLPAPTTSSAPAAAPKNPLKEVNKPGAKIRRLPWWPLSILALLMIGALWFLLPTKDTNSAVYLSEQYFVLPPNNVTAGSPEADIDLYQTAYAQFFAEDYQAARANFSQLKNNLDYRTDVLLFLPHTAFLLKDYPTAETEFSTALADPNLEDSGRSLLRWNAMINSLAQGKDISNLLSEEWPANYRLKELRKALLEE